MYCSCVSVISSVRPIIVRTLAVIRDERRSPASVTTGTPIHSDSQAVVWPHQGKTSSETSIDE